MNKKKIFLKHFMRAILKSKILYFAFQMQIRHVLSYSTNPAPPSKRLPLRVLKFCSVYPGISLAAKYQGALSGGLIFNIKY
jgi:hypothetical protein